MILKHGSAAGLSQLRPPRGVQSDDLVECHVSLIIRQPVYATVPKPYIS